MRDHFQTLNTNLLNNGGVRIDIPAPRSKARIRLIFLILIVGISSLAILEFARRHVLTLNPQSFIPTIYRIVQVAECLAIVFLVSEGLTGKDTMKVESFDLLIQHSVLGVTTTARQFRTQQVKNLRFKQSNASSGHELDSGGLYFEVGGAEQKFGEALTRSQAEEIICMIERST